MEETKSMDLDFKFVIAADSYTIKTSFQITNKLQTNSCYDKFHLIITDQARYDENYKRIKQFIIS